MSVKVMSNQSHSVLWNQYGVAVLHARKQGNFNKAARVLRDAFLEFEEYGEISPDLVLMAHELAELHLNNFRYEEAEDLYRLVLEMREKVLGQTHADVIESLKKVAIVQIMAFRVEALGRKVVRSPFPWGEVNNIVAAAS